MLPKEIEEGNIEYKRQISDEILLNPSKLTKFKTQLLWRLEEGKQLSGVSHAIYYIGIEDNGLVSNQTKEEVNNSIINFTKIVKLVKANILTTEINEYAKITVQKLDDEINIDECTVALLGPSDTGKSTFLGVLIYDILDDGYGLARSNVLRHDHEKVSGQTTSIQYMTIGTNKNNNIINYNSNFIYSYENIIKESSKLINFIDLPGDIKYLKTTIFGLTAHKIDHALIFISLTDQNNPIIQLHMDLCKKLEIKNTIIYTKSDLVTSNLDNKISSLTGEGYNNIKDIIKEIKIKNSNKIMNKKTTEFVINDLMIIPDIGQVIIGYTSQGRIKVSDKLLIGPYNNKFYTVEVVSIHKKYSPCKYLYENETGTIIIKNISLTKINITKHMLLITSDHLINFKNKVKIKLQDPIKELIKFTAFFRNTYDILQIESINDNIIDAIFTNIQYIKKDEFIILRNNNDLYVGIILE